MTDTLRPGPTGPAVERVHRHFGVAAHIHKPEKSKAGTYTGLEWWRWRESNPRPKNSTTNFYKLSRPLPVPGESLPTALYPGQPMGA